MLCSWIIEIDVWLVHANIQLYHIKDKPKIGFIPQRTATIQRTHLLLEGDDTLHFSGEHFIKPHFVALVSQSPLPASLLPTSCPLLAALHFGHPFNLLLLMWLGILARLGGKHWFKRGDRLLAISFVFPAEQTSAEVERKINVRFRERLFITAHQSQPTRSHPSYLMESQSNRLLKVITITL